MRPDRCDHAAYWSARYRSTANVRDARSAAIVPRLSETVLMRTSFPRFPTSAGLRLFSRRCDRSAGRSKTSSILLRSRGFCQFFRNLHSAREDQITRMRDHPVGWADSRPVSFEMAQREFAQVNKRKTASRENP